MSSILGSVAGPLAGLAGGLLSSSKKNSALKRAAEASRFRPFGVNTPLGDIGFRNNRAFARPSAEQAELTRLLQGSARQNLFPGGTVQDFREFSERGSFPLLRQGANELLNNPNLIGPAFNQFAPSSEAAEGLFSGLGVAGLSRAFGGPSAVPFASQAQELAGGLLSPNITRAVSQGQTEDIAGELGGFGRDLLSTGSPDDFRDIASQQLEVLREQAAPFEERQFNSLQQRLFNQGRLDSTGGGRQTEAFARGLGQADLQRQLTANQLARQIQQQNAQQNLQQRQLGAGLLGNAGSLAEANARLQGSLRGQDVSLAGQGLAAGADLFQTGIRGIGLEQLQSRGLGGLGQGLLSAVPNIQENQFDVALNADRALNQRAANRIRGAQGLFGFGQDLENQRLQRALAGIAGIEQQQGLLTDLINIGGNFGAAQAKAGANAGEFLAQRGSPLGGFLTGLGGAIGKLDFGGDDGG